jgi:hypothetical protein
VHITVSLNKIDVIFCCWIDEQQQVAEELQAEEQLRERARRFDGNKSIRFAFS